MATLNIGGQRVKVSDAFLSMSPEQQNAAVEEIASSLGGTPPESDTTRDLRGELSAMTQNPRAAPQPYGRGAFQAASEGLKAGAMGGFDDEIGAGMAAIPDAVVEWLKGNGFDVGRSYNRIQGQLDTDKAGRRTAHPIASGVGEVTGGLGLGAGAAKAGLSIAARPGASMARRIGAGAAEGGAYGALYGAGEAKPGERLSGAATGALMGAGVGGAVGGVGGALANRTARRMTPVDNAPGAAALAKEGGALYKAMRASGVALKPEKANAFRASLDDVLASTDEELAEEAFKLRRLANKLGDAPDIEKLHNYAKSVNRVLGSNLKGEDKHFVGLIKNQVETLIDGMSGGDLTGKNPAAMWKQADKLWQRHKKTEMVERIIDFADVDGQGKYTQAGFANAIKNEMKALYKKIRKGQVKGYSPQEIALIRQMARGGSNSAVVNLFAKFAPRGVISALGGPAIGGALAGPVGAVAAPALGHMAGKMADRGAMQAAQTLKDAVARGFVQEFPRLPNRLTPLIPGGTEAMLAIPRGRGGS